MGFLETVSSAKTYLREHGRVSLSALRLEFDLDDARLESLIEELVDVQQVAAREGKVLSWIATGAAAQAQPESEAQTTVEAPSEATPQAPEAERRQLTVLFCDLVDSTEIASRLDVEDWRRIMSAYHDAVSEVVNTYGGHVAQRLGDGLLVYFGWPQAHEDDAERALRAGRDTIRGLKELNERLREEEGIQLAARVGVHTGPVVVGKLGDAAQSETLALGDTTHLAARIQALAAPNTVLASEVTLQLTRGVFVTEELGPRTLKGAPEPLVIHRVIQPAGVRSRLDVGRRTWTPFVGREQELGLLVDRWEQALEGDGQSVFIAGEAGLGKSRLALTLRENVGHQPHIWLECRASPYTQASAFHPITQLILQGIRARPTDDPAVTLRSLETGVRDADLDTASVVPLMADLLGIPLSDAYPPLQLSTELQREKTLEAFVAWTLSLGRIRPLLLLVEDLHWCDPSSIELLGRLIDQIPTSPVMMMLTARPEFEVPWRSPKSWTPIALGRLRRRPAQELARLAAGENELPAEALPQILTRAGGVPLYLEELTRSALESWEAGPDVSIPTTLQDSLMARLDRLSAAKEVAQLASVLGREFSYPLVEAVCGLATTALRTGLKRLVEADLLFERGSPPESVYIFKHALVQEAAYESMLRSRRQEVHRRTATVLKSLFPQRVDAEPELLARHCEMGELFEEASRSYLRAAERSASRSAHAEAVSHLERCLDLLKHTDEGSERHGIELAAQTTLGASLQITKGFTSQEAKAAYERAQELCEVVKDPEQLLSALWGLAALQQTAGQLDKAIHSARAICEQAQATGRRLEEIAGHQIMGASRYCRGQFREAAASLASAIEGYRPSDSPALVEAFGQDVAMWASAYAIHNEWFLGRPDRAAAQAHEAVKRARLLEHPFTLAFVSDFAAVVFGMRREAEPMKHYASEAIRVSETYGFPLFLGVGRILTGWAHAGEAGAVEELQQGMALAGGTGNQALVPLIFGVLSETCHAGGRFDEAISAADLGLTLAEQTRQHLWDAELLRRKAEALLRSSEATETEVERLLERASAIACSQETRSLELRAATSLSRLWQRQGKRAEARDLLQPVYDWFTEGFDTQDLKDAKALLEELG